MSNMVFELREPDKTEVPLAAVGDLHWGSHTCNESSVRAWAKKIEQEQWHWVGVGDYTENALRSSVGDIHKQTMAPDEQVESLGEIFKPIGHLCLRLIGGNHGVRSIKAAGYDVDSAFAKAIGTDDNKVLYRREEIFGMTQVGEARWKIVVHHCAGGGRTMGGKANALARMGESFPLMHLYIGGHTHAAISFNDHRYDLVVNAGSAKVLKTNRQFSGCGSTLEYMGSYAEAALFPPASVCQVVHHLGDRVHRSHHGVPFYEMKYRRDVVML